MINKIKVCCIQKVIPLAFDESLSYLEMLCGVLSKLNESIDKLNSLAEIVDNIDVNFDEINEKIEVINQTIQDIQDNFVNFESRININVDNKLSEHYNLVLSLMNDYQNIFTSQLNNLRYDLEEQIRQIELGNVKAYDPTTGEISNISIVIQNVYDALRSGAITCTEFDNLELTCTSFENYEISAYNFDLNARNILL